MSNPWSQAYEELRKPYLEGKMAKKDYDGDGKVESGAKEYRGVIHNKIQQKMGKKGDGKDTSSVKEHHQKDADGNVIPHGDGTPSSVEEEQINELSKKTLGGYIKKASKETRGNMVATQHGSGIPKRAKDIKLKQVNKRLKGMEKAGEKLAKEEVEEISELSKGTLKSYANKALDSVKGYEKTKRSMIRQGMGKDHPFIDREVKKRKKGVDLATKKIKKEETVNEISMPKNTSYEKMSYNKLKSTHKDFKNMDSKPPRVAVLDKKTGGTVSKPVKFVPDKKPKSKMDETITLTKGDYASRNVPNSAYSTAAKKKFDPKIYKAGGGLGSNFLPLVNSNEPEGEMLEAKVDKLSTSGLVGAKERAEARNKRKFGKRDSGIDVPSKRGNKYNPMSSPGGSTEYYSDQRGEDHAAKRGVKKVKGVKENVDEAKVDKMVPDHKRSGKRLERYGNPHGSLALGGGIQRDRRADHAARRGKKTKGMKKEDWRTDLGFIEEAKKDTEQKVDGKEGSVKNKVTINPEVQVENAVIDKIKNDFNIIKKAKETVNKYNQKLQQNNDEINKVLPGTASMNNSYEPEGEVVEDAKMGRMTDDDLSAAHKKFSGMDQKSPANKFMMKRISKEMNRRKKKVNEEQINELSKKTLANYTRKSATSLAKHSMDFGGKPNKKSSKKIEKRHAGIMRATSKLAKESLLDQVASAFVNEATRMKKEMGYDKGGTKKPKGPKAKDAALDAIKAKYKGQIMRSGSNQPKKVKGAKPSGGGKFKMMADKKKETAADAKKRGFKNTQDYVNTMARYGGKDNYDKGKGLGT